MSLIKKSLLFYYFLYISQVLSNVQKTKRQKFLEDELLLAVGGNVPLTEKESIVNNCLMQHKFNEIDYAFTYPQYFNFSHHYFLYKDLIKHSKVYNIIRDMPKGAALHVHDMALMKPDYLLNLTYLENLYICFDGDNIDLHFSDGSPKQSCQDGWQLVKNARNTSKDPKEFDASLKKHFSIVCDDPDKTYPSIKESWSKFMTYFRAVAPLVSYRPVWEKYFYDALKSFRNDNVMYLEVRSVLPNLYELDGTVYDQTVTAKAYRKTIKRFMKNYPDFLGAKLIFAPSRLVNKEQLHSYLETAKQLKKSVPEIFAGFDLVGPEDEGYPLIDFVPQLEEAASELDYFFHAGETDWYGTTTDDNLVDAILLGAKRLGHAYALPKHPLLMAEVQKRDIGLEINVISNAVLSLVRDVRNHPLAVFLAHGLPVVLSSDDPGVWGADPLSHDFYVAFVGVASKLSDIRLLKTLALNSLKYSALSDSEKIEARSKFLDRWNDFINKFNCTQY